MDAIDRDGVHATHCCAKCGCKYADDDCPVANGRIKPVYGCSECGARVDTIDDGGRAFPMATIDGYTQEGMTLRDYFAVHNTPPGVVEIAKAAGVGVDKSFRIYLTADANHGIAFNEWWISLSLTMQCELSAKVRYALADAMLKARNEPR